MTSPLQFHTFTADMTGNRLPYALHMPDDYAADAARNWPLVLSLHGIGERGDDPALLGKHGPLRQVEQGRELPFVLVAPQCPAHSTWLCELDVLHGLLDAVAAEHRVDPDRVYCTGLSMGGTGTWALAARYPDRFAAILPICGKWRPEAAARIRTLPIWTFHGEADVTIPIAHTERLVEALRELGSDVRFSRYPGVGHDSWTQTYDNPEVYAWLLEQRRGK